MDRRPLHICIVTSDFPGLTETFITNKVLELRKRGHRVTVIKNSSAGIINSSHLALVKEAGIEILIMKVPASIADTLKVIIHHPVIFFRSLSFSFTQFKEKFKSRLQLHLLNKHPYDVIHFEFSGLGVAYLESIKKLTAKTVVSCRGTAEKVKPLTDKKRKDSLSVLFSSVNAIHCVSEDMANTIKKYGADSNKIFVNTPAIDTSVFKRSKEYTSSKTGLNILTIGRLTFQKGYLLGLLAMKALKEKDVNFKWQIVGDGPLLEEITYHINALELQDNVELLGKKNRDEILALYNTVDLFLLSSVYEGIANVCLEAMAMELPIVSTKSGGMEEVITHGVDGLLCEVYDPAGIVDQLQNIATNFSLRRQLGLAARETVVNKFTLQKQVDVFEEQYYKLVNN